MIVENLTTVSRHYTEKIVGDIHTMTITNPGNSGYLVNSSDWEIANIVSSSEPITDNIDGTPLIRATWSNDGITWYDSATEISYAFTINYPGGSTIQSGLSAGLTIGVDSNNVYVRCANGSHGNVSLDNNGRATWTGIPKTFYVRYILLQSTSDVNISSKSTIPSNKVIKTGTVHFSGSIYGATSMTQVIPIDYSPNFFAVEFNVNNHVYSSDLTNVIPNNVWSHSGNVLYYINGQSPNQIAVNGGVRNDNNLTINAFISSGSASTTTTDFYVDYRIIDLGANQSINGMDTSTLALTSRVNSPTRYSNEVRTGAGGTAKTVTSYTKEFSGLSFVDFFFDCDNNGIFWRNGYRQDSYFFAQGTGGDIAPFPDVYSDNSGIYAGWVSGVSNYTPVSPAGRAFRFVEYGDYNNYN